MAIAIFIVAIIIISMFTAPSTLKTPNLIQYTTIPPIIKIPTALPISVYQCILYIIFCEICLMDTLNKTLVKKMFSKNIHMDNTKFNVFNKNNVIENERKSTI